MFLLQIIIKIVYKQFKHDKQDQLTFCARGLFWVTHKISIPRAKQIKSHKGEYIRIYRMTVDGC